MNVCMCFFFALIICPGYLIALRRYGYNQKPNVCRWIRWENITQKWHEWHVSYEQKLSSNENKIQVVNEDETSPEKICGEKGNYLLTWHLVISIQTNNSQCYKIHILLLWNEMNFNMTINKNMGYSAKSFRSRRSRS